MQLASVHPDWPEFCPECETELDRVSGACPACRWDRTRAASRTPDPAPPVATYETTFTERYRGRSLQPQPVMTDARGPALARGRLFVIFAFVAVLLMGAIAMGAFGSV
jgi:hypothetical protein